MQYQGGKSKYAKRIAEVINSYYVPGHCFYEPFVGGNSIAALVNFDHCQLSDVNRYIVAAWEALRAGFTPFKFGKATYDHCSTCVRNDTPSFIFTDAEIGYIILSGSFSGKWLGGFMPPNTPSRDYLREGIDSFMRAKIHPTTLFRCGSYESQNYALPGVIYCDPPYAHTMGYRQVQGFNHAEFYDWAVTMSRTHTVLISESSMPNDYFTEIVDFTRPLNSGILTKPRNEKLYMPK